MKQKLKKNTRHHEESRVSLPVEIRLKENVGIQSTLCKTSLSLEWAIQVCVIRTKLPFDNFI